MKVSPLWRGRWTRQLLRVPGVPDEVTSTVIWLQSDHLFIDLRVPAGRPDFADTPDLAACTPLQRAWLARQEGFAGHLEAYDEVLRWHRHFEYGPPATLPDAGRMTQEARWWLEEGLHAPYLEHWTHTPWRGGPCLGRKFMLGPTTREAGWREGMAVVVDDFFMLAIDRDRTAPGSDGASALDLEISFGALDAASGIGHITLSTLPFREGLVLDGTAVAAAPPDLAFLLSHPALRERPLHWQTGTAT